jgi:penicillin-binding protein 1C
MSRFLRLALGRTPLRLFLRAPFCSGAALGGLLAAAFAFAFCLPDPLFQPSWSHAVFARDGRLLSARIAADGQWRFPLRSTPPARWVTCLLEAEDRRFFLHPGVDPLAIARATRENLLAGRVVSGASTLTMQTIRMARGNRPRAWGEKLVEAIWALRLELASRKDDILRLYAEHAPMGGNTVGLEAAAWRYFQRGPTELSWAESALLAVLPNQPSAIHPGRNRSSLLAKRNALLKRLADRRVLDSLEYECAVLEPLPGAPGPLPNLAPHLVEALRGQGQAVFASSLIADLQRRSEEVLRRYVGLLASNEVHNAAAIIVENRSGRVLAYLGNVASSKEHQGEVDMITAPRSSGSILKPFLHAAALDQGLILPKSLLEDIPRSYAGYSPKNFDTTYEGVVPADQALSRSRNTTAVALLARFGVPRFHSLLQRLGAQTLDQPPSHYGLSLVLGGAETRLIDLVTMYSGLARTLLFLEETGNYPAHAFASPQLGADETLRLQSAGQDPPVLDACAIHQTLTALTRVQRPESQHLWSFFSSARRIAWKTGTSFGFRDAWAVGLDRNHTIAVWVGNADGEGRPGLTGMSCAGPILFELFGLLPPEGKFFKAPPGQSLNTCVDSGFLAGPHCRQKRLERASRRAALSPACPYHVAIQLDESGSFRVRPDCYDLNLIQSRSWFLLPPAVAAHYQRHTAYQAAPPFHPACTSLSSGGLALVYPPGRTSVLIPVQLDGRSSSAVFQAAHREKKARIFWHVDETFLGVTESPHAMPIRVPPGEHRLVLVDEQGNSLSQRFAVIPNAQQRAEGNSGG